MGNRGNAFISFAETVVEIFDSLYESFQALTSVQVSHFVEWFSGSVFDSNTWVLTQIISSGTTAVMDDSIDGGVILNSDGSSQGSLTFNDKRHYDPAESIVIFSIRFSSTIYDTGYGFSADTAGVGGTDQVSIHNRSASSFILGQSGDGSGVSETATDVPPDLNSHTHKIELTSSNILFTLDGVLKLTKTTNRPVSKQMPILEMSSANGAGKMHCFYLECYNTSISILSSLHERLSPLTQVLKQRVVETFSGALLNERWTENNVTGTNTFAMADEIDGGFKITTGTSGSDNGIIDFNDIRQYDPAASVLIAIAKKTSTTATRTRVAIGNTTPNIGTHIAYYDANTEVSNFRLATGDGGGASFTNTSITLDAAWHLIVIDNGVTNTLLSMDGVLEVTKSTDKPTLKMAPSFYVVDLASSSAKTGQIRYLEAYNKLTTETDYPSVYELFNELTTISDQHFWEWFDGDALRNIWNKNDVVGTNTFQMTDDIDEGYTMITAATAGAVQALDFNQKRQYAPAASEIIIVARRVSGTNHVQESGLSNTSYPATDYGRFIDADVNSFKKLETADGSTVTSTDSSVSVNTTWTGYKIAFESANVLLYIDGVLEITKSTNRPTVKMQPLMGNRSFTSAAAKESRVRYVEAYNTISSIIPGETFASLYESFQELTSVQVSHFVEWFSGDALDSIWTDGGTGGSNSMEDVIDGGLLIATSTTNNSYQHINFNDKRHYDYQDSIFISTMKVNASTAAFYSGFCRTVSSIGSLVFGTGTDYMALGRGESGNYLIQTADGTTASSTTGSVASDTNYHSFKGVMGASNNLFFLDGVLEVTKTTNLCSVDGLQPFHAIRTGTAAVRSMNVLFTETFNTSITILSSLYERLSALTQVMGQRVVETFSGAVINERWVFADLNGTGSIAMDDSIDGGAIFTSGATNGNQSELTFDDTRQYDFDNTVIITVAKLSSTSSIKSYPCGLLGFDSFGSDFALTRVATNFNSFFNLQTQDASTASTTTGTLAIDANYHTHKLELGSADVKQYIDGVLEITKTTNRPTVKLQPAFLIGTFTGTAKSLNMVYCEAYNKLATETDYPSVYELFNPLTTVATQHFWDWFDGSDLSNKWIAADGIGTPTFVMTDEVDGGFSMISDATANSRGSLTFGTKRPFDPTASVVIAVTKRDVGTNVTMLVGFDEDVTTGVENVLARDGSNNTFKDLVSADASTASAQDSDVAIDQAWTGYKIECGSADLKLTIDGVLKVTKTTNRPTVKLSPDFEMHSFTTAAAGKIAKIRYYEAYNT